MTAFKGRQYVHLESPNPKPVVVASECDLYGHDYQVRDVEGKHEPDLLFCPRCWTEWYVGARKVPG